MILSTVPPRREAKSGKSCGACRHAGWILSLSYAALLAAAVWKLDGAELPARATTAPLGVLTTVLDWTRARLGPWGDTRPGEHGVLTSQQVQPEGWPSWTDAPATTPARQQR